VSYADLSGLRVLSGRVRVPAGGAWTAELSVVDDAPLAAGPVTLTLGNLVLVGAVARSAAHVGLLMVQLVGGAGGWGTPLPPRAYQNPPGVLLSMVLGDAAIEAGEALAVEGDRTLGTDFVRMGGAGGTLLSALAPGWWVDGAGLTHTAPRAPGAAITSDAVVEAYSGSAGRLVVSTEDPAAWLPGATFANATLTTPLVIDSVCFHLENADILRVEALVT
jgi:hypothetical protein